MFLELKAQATSILKEAIRKAGFEVEDSELQFETSPHADLASRAAFRLAGIHRQNPKDLASRIVSAVEIPEGSFIGKVSAAGPYINFFAGKHYLNGTVNAVLKEKEKFGCGAPKDRILLEHTSANPNGPLHVGHIRNSIIGDTLARILRRAGYDVEVQYYVNDMGRQIAVVSWACERFELDLSRKSDSAIADVYIKANVELDKNPEYIKEIDALMEKVEAGDVRTIEHFDKAVSLAVAGIKETLLRLNVAHDKFVSESTFLKSGAVHDIVERIKATGRTKTDKGALVVDLSDYGFEKTLVIQRSNGTSLYTTRDLAYHEWKTGQADRIIDVFGADHKLISGQLRATLNTIGVKEPEVVIFEFVSLPEGSMSTRRGQFISADDLFDRVTGAAFEQVETRRPETSYEFKKQVAEAVGLGAVRYDIVRVSPEKSTVFNWKEALDFEKQGAPYIQYSHARACSILEKAKEEAAWNPDKEIDPSLLVEDSEIDLIKKMAMFDSVIDLGARELKPHVLAIYARELADAFNQFYRFVPVIAAEDENVRAARLALVDCARVVLANSLDTLGIIAPESM
ncbi:arginine--tRNA ligase [Methanosarcina mazei]|uniref:Arginine--tRNA ligase n=2 Tax=Methanosarcina mazei TaxID=2209 RepID=A0A0F8IT13_METMZ|nr:arginine--tRNA ligase [Methanosarcina mazei]AKB73228.1 Arginyl-tRNA synthetase [Methanosarcina mazei C16]KKF98881.1 arginyl-tRNA synthetase [Methanosarcina mazei]KKG06803.1 arginyl-tRNA synthetase [Methanosarcina mazei]KKG07442.1 arginyl-tRNA synthetase [Methanosarcina mazei]KKG16320.1 arginyl-tRNA synthetase [Methanosarcina mazei]